MGFGWRRRSLMNTTKNIVPPPLEELAVPKDFLCPVSLDLMKDPVTLSSGITYDRSSIDTWLHGGNSTCPVTKQAVTNPDPIPNHALRKMIQEWCVKNRRFGIERIPTPRSPFEVSQTLSALSESARDGDFDACSETVKKIKKWGSESGRNRSCFAENRGARVLAGAFEKFAEYSETLTLLSEEVLSVLDWMLPLDDVEALRCMGSYPSVRCLVRLLETSGDVSVRKTAALVLKELSTTRKMCAWFGEVNEALVRLIEQPISPPVTKSSLSVVFNLVSCQEEMKSTFVEMGLVETLIETLVGSDRSVSEKSLAVLDRLCGSDKGRERAYRHCLAVPVLVKKILRVSELATELSVSILWSLVEKCEDREDRGRVVVESVQVGAFQKLLVVLQVGCGEETKEKATELLKMMNPYRGDQMECIESVDFKSLKRSF